MCPAIIARSRQPWPRSPNWLDEHVRTYGCGLVRERRNRDDQGEQQRNDETHAESLGQAELGAVGVGVDRLQLLHALDVVARLRELDPDALLPPAVDVRLARVVGGERELLVVVLVEQVAEVPGAVADVQLRIAQVLRLSSCSRPSGRRSPGPSPAAAASGRLRPTTRRRRRRTWTPGRSPQRRVVGRGGSSRRARRRSARSGADSAAARTSVARSRGRRRRTPRRTRPRTPTVASLTPSAPS